MSSVFNEITIHAKDVRPNDLLYHNMNGNQPPAYWWHRVRLVEKRDGAIIILDWSSSEYRKHPKEAVTVRRPTN